MTASSLPGPLPAPNTAQGPAQPATIDGLFGALWPERDPAARPRVVAGAAAVGLLAAVVVPFRDHGLGTFLVLVAAGAAVLSTRLSAPLPVPLSKGRAWSPYLVAACALCLPLVAVVLVRDAAWVAALCVLAAFGLGASALVDARTVVGTVASAAAVPLAGLRGLPWLGRSLRAVGGLGSLWPVLRTAAVSVLLVAVFGALFVSGDALFASWVDALLPDLTLGSTVLRAFVLVMVGGVTLAASYVALNPPDTDRLAPRAGVRVARVFEWLVPVGLVLALYAGLVAAQLTVMFGGHGYLRRTTGLTYAEYVHQGFGQLILATVLTLAVVATTARKAPLGSGRDRVLLRGVLGGLCALTLVVVASALFRLHVYEEAYGFTRLRLLVSVFEAWLGLVLLLVLVTGMRLRGWWVPRAAVLSGAAALLVLAAANPDGYIAQRNVERYLETGRADWYYLADLSADAVPALRGLPAEARACVFTAPTAPTDDWLEWNLGRARAGSTALGAEAGCAAR